MIIHDCEQGTQEWFLLRRGVPTASEFHRIITAKGLKLSNARAKYIDQLISESMSKYFPERAECYTSRAMDHGKATEQKARDWYALETGLIVRKVGFITTDDGRFGCSPDALIYEGDTPVGGLELKCPEGHTHVRYLRGGVVPSDRLAQVHGGPVVTGLKWWDFLSFPPEPKDGDNGLPPFLIRTYPDRFTNELKVRLEQFWAEYVEAMEKVRSL